MNSINKQIVNELAWDIQRTIDDRIQEEIERRACEIYDNEGVSISLEEQDSIYHEVYDAIMAVIR